MPTFEPVAALAPGTVRWTVLHTLATQQPEWTAPQVTAHTELDLGRVILALGWLQKRGLIRARCFIGVDTLWSLTDDGREQLEQEHQLAMELT